jgi:short-subunit dehydrogenase
VKLDGKRVILTGASAGIGAGLATAMAARGAKLALAARNKAQLEEVARACSGDTLVIPTDVADPEACRKLVEITAMKWGGVDVLINNAGLTMSSRFDELTDLSVFERIMKVNFHGPVALTFHALPHLKQSKGLAVAISSLTGKMGVPYRSAYSASKHALQGFYDTLRIELHGSGVDVLVVSPGFVATDVRARALGADGKPLGQSQHDEERLGNMSVEECSRRIVTAIEQRRRELVMTARGRLVQWMKLIAPRRVDQMIRRTIEKRRR